MRELMGAAATRHLYLRLKRLPLLRESVPLYYFCYLFYRKLVRKLMLVTNYTAHWLL